MRITKLSKVLSLVLTICITFGMIVPANADEVTTEVTTEATQNVETADAQSVDAEATDAETVDVEATEAEAEAEPEVEVINFDETYEFKFIERFNLMQCYDYNFFDANIPVKRAEYASILCTLGGFTPVTGGNQFVDIGDNEYKKQINAVSAKKLMSGFDKFTFLPDKDIVLSEVIKPILLLAGYEHYANKLGGYPNGFLQVAGELDILDGLNISANDVVTRGDLARIIYNARNLEIYDSPNFVDVEGETKNETLMTKYMNIDCIRGVVKDNGITGLRSDEKTRAGYITIGTKQFKIGSQFDARTLIGRYVEAYFTNKPDSDGEKTIEYIHLDKKYLRDEIVFDIDKFIDFSGRVIKFENEKEKEQKIELTTSVNIIYNNKAIKAIKASMFDYDYGTVTYVPARKGAADTIIIEGFVSWFVTASDKDFNYITTSDVCQPINGVRRLDIPVSEIGKTVLIEDYYGREGDFFDISAYDVIDICKSGDYMYIKVVEPDIQEKVVKGKVKVDDKPALSFADGDVYVVSPYYATTADYNNISLGNLYYVYRNSAGHIVKLDTIINVDMKTAFLIGSYYDEIDEVGFIKILTEDGSYQTLTAAEKITFSDNKNVTTPSMLFKNAHYTNLDNYQGVLNYSVNKLGLVKKIYMPVDIGVEREKGRLGLIYDASSISEYYYGNSVNLGQLFLFPMTGRVFKQYKSATTMEERYKVGTRNTIGIIRADPTKAYNYDPYALTADIVYQEPKEAGGNEEIQTNTVYIVTDMSEETIYADETYVIVKTVSIPGAVETTFYAKAEELQNAMDTAKTSPERTDWDVEKGDIILVSTKSTDASIIENVILLWDANALNPINPQKGRRGNVPGNIGYANSSNGPLSNPYIWYNATAIGPGGGISESYRTIFGYAYYLDEKGGLVLTTQDVTAAPFDPNASRSKFAQRAFLTTAANLVSVSYKDGQVEARRGTGSDFRTYIGDGEGCSKVLAMSNGATLVFMVVFNGEMK